MTTITAYLNGVVGTTSVNVSNARMTSISLAPGTATIPLGGTQTFAAVGTFDDGTTQNLSSEPVYLVQQEGDDQSFVWDVMFLNWTSTANNVAILNKAGVATSTGKGSTTIQATMDGVVFGSATLNVQ
jgi:hypothetical protein